MSERSTSHDLDPKPRKPEALHKFESRWDQTLLCVGLDTEYERIPQSIVVGNFEKVNAVDYFNTKIIEETSELVCAFKPNIAFYEPNGDWGRAALRRTIRRVERLNIPLILDAKRGDIGNTSKELAKDIFDNYKVDAITLNGFGGNSRLDQNGEQMMEDLAPFLENKDVLSFVWCKSSNPAGGELQDLPIALDRLTDNWKKRFGNLDGLAEKLPELDGIEEMYGKNTAPFFLVMAYKAVKDWNLNGNIGLVAGATYPQELKWIRQVVGDVPILVPGVGSQEGNPEEAVRAGLNSENQGLIVNAARSVIYASSDEKDFAQAARGEALKLRDTINLYRGVI